MQTHPHPLQKVIQTPRVFAWSLVALTSIAAWLQTDADVLLWLAGFCLLFPACLNILLRRASHQQIRLSMLVDATVAGTATALLNGETIVAMTLVLMVLVSLLIVGGVKLLMMGLPTLVLGFSLFYRSRVTENVDLDFLALASLSAYFGVIGFLVYRETFRLATEQHRVRTVGQQLQNLQRRLLPYVAPQVIRWDRPEIHRKRLTILFSDIEGFTEAMEMTDESVVAGWLNRYFCAMSKIVEVHGGTIDKFLGDGLMVFFGDPETEGAVSDAYACIAMAIEMQDKLASVAGELGAKPVRLRIGIHTGYCLVGSFGSEARLDYTALGSAVNLASRIEGAAQADEILISEETYRLLRPWIQVVNRGRHRLKGFAGSVNLYRVVRLSCPGNGKYLSHRIQLLT